MTHKIDSRRVVGAVQIAARMAEAGLEADFVRRAVGFADSSEGVLDLMELWDEASSEEDRNACVADLEEAMKDIEDAPSTPLLKPYVPYADLDAVVGQIRAHKQHLRNLIDRHGGVSEVARKAGIPQPSLSRMLNSNSMPRRSTLYKIAAALDVPEREVVGEWVQ